MIKVSDLLQLMLERAETERLKNDLTIVESPRTLSMVTMAARATSTVNTAALATGHNHCKLIY